jgi:hypothetical protein
MLLVLLDVSEDCVLLGCDFFERVGEKRTDIRQFLGYVCQIAKVRVRINFGWVSLFTQKGGSYVTVLKSYIS